MKKSIYKNLKTLCLIIFIAYISSLVLVQKLGNSLNKTISNYATVEAERFGTYMINYSIDKEFVSNLDDDLLNTKTSDSGEIQIVDFKSKKANELLENITMRIQKNLVKLENGDIKDFDLATTFNGVRYRKIKSGVVCEIPEGIIFSNVLLSNTGPVIPVKFSFVGQVTSNIKTKVSSYGINSVYIEIYAHVEVKEKITMPVGSKDITVKNDIPIAMKIIQGSIPNYYQNPIISDSSQFSLPIS